MENYQFGYPKKCARCYRVPGDTFDLKVQPYFRAGDTRRLMLIGQDPTIFRKPERVRHVLMLDEPTGQLTRWLSTLIGPTAFNSLTLYATNLVKCSFSAPPSTTAEGGLKFLAPYFHHCQSYLVEEIKGFRPDLVITLGEPAHQLFVDTLDDPGKIPVAMQSAFTGAFTQAMLGGVEFSYSPCLHIKTFRVAETYGHSVRRFKEGLATHLQERG